MSESMAGSETNSQRPAGAGLGLAIANRLRRAAGFGSSHSPALSAEADTRQHRVHSHAIDGF